MTIQEMADCLQMVCDARKGELAVPTDEGTRSIGRKYPQDAAFESIDERIMRAVEALAFNPASMPAPANFFTASELNHLFAQLYLEQTISGKDNYWSLAVLENYKCYLKVDLIFPANETVLEQNFHYAVDLYLSGSEIFSGVGSCAYLNRQVRAARHLQPLLSAPLSIADGKIILSQKDAEQIQVKLEGLIAQAGGYNVLERLFREEIDPHYDQQLDHFYIVRQKHHGPLQQMPPSALPCNYLIQLAIKHIVPSAGIRYASNGAYETICSIAQDLVTVLDLTTPFSGTELLCPVYEMTRFISENALYEGLCIPTQYAPEFCKLLMCRLYLPMMRAKGSNATGLARSLPAILSWCLSLRPMTVFTEKEVQTAIGLGRQQIEAALEFCAQDWSQVNQSFRSFYDQPNYHFYPLIRLPKGEYFLFAPHFCGYAFCECAYQLLKKSDSLLDRHLGPKLEELVKQLLKEKHIPYSCGFYREAGECDLVVEGENAILFVELKKRPLPNEFHQGGDVEILHALADGMIYGQIQALGHRQHLEQDKCLALYQTPKAAEPNTTITLRERTVYTMSVCLPEYAFFTVAPLAQHFLLMLQGKVVAVDERQNKRLVKFNKLAEQFRHLMANEQCWRQYLHFSCFRSLQQVWIALQNCGNGNADTLINLLMCDCTVVSSSLDFYHSLKIAESGSLSQ